MQAALSVWLLLREFRKRLAPSGGDSRAQAGLETSTVAATAAEETGGPISRPSPQRESIMP
jgi:hypothetical protein